MEQVAWRRVSEESSGGVADSSECLAPAGPVVGGAVLALVLATLCLGPVCTAKEAARGASQGGSAAWLRACVLHGPPSGPEPRAVWAVGNVPSSTGGPIHVPLTLHGAQGVLRLRGAGEGSVSRKRRWAPATHEDADSSDEQVPSRVSMPPLLHARRVCSPRQRC